jgi:hypothetical protein
LAKVGILKQPKHACGMGFRDLHAFNIAMLAKQGWRMIQNSDSLCAQILKAKYYPNGDILQARARGGISYTWRNILEGIKLVKRGMIWRIGNGQSVNIWNGPWVPRGLTRQPCSHRGQHIIQWISELIDPMSGAWDEELVRQTFQSKDTLIILAIPVCEDFEDYIGWYFDTRGIFSVKSAYKVQMDYENDR